MPRSMPTAAAAAARTGSRARTISSASKSSSSRARSSSAGWSSSASLSNDGDAFRFMATATPPSVQLVPWTPAPGDPISGDLYGFGVHDAHTRTLMEERGNLLRLPLYAVASQLAQRPPYRLHQQFQARTPHNGGAFARPVWTVRELPQSVTLVVARTTAGEDGRRRYERRLVAPAERGFPQLRRQEEPGGAVDPRRRSRILEVDEPVARAGEAVRGERPGRGARHRGRRGARGVGIVELVVEDARVASVGAVAVAAAADDEAGDARARWRRAAGPPVVAAGEHAAERGARGGEGPGRERRQARQDLVDEEVVVHGQARRRAPRLAADVVVLLLLRRWHRRRRLPLHGRGLAVARVAARARRRVSDAGGRRRLVYAGHARRRHFRQQIKSDAEVVTLDSRRIRSACAVARLCDGRPILDNGDEAAA
ncbi:hypothetical protein U9M48_004611 [Paspalum notatum var. saurae]|uniref:Uncharacterized protein n=1 Tax=Paspalum notatum var. saurae TaxID=547442 RepID=A0AAQ3PV37_PASNO